MAETKQKMYLDFYNRLDTKEGEMDLIKMENRVRRMCIRLG